MAAWLWSGSRLGGRNASFAAVNPAFMGFRSVVGTLFANCKGDPVRCRHGRVKSPKIPHLMGTDSSRHCRCLFNNILSQLGLTQTNETAQPWIKKEVWLWTKHKYVDSGDATISSFSTLHPSGHSNMRQCDCWQCSIKKKLSPIKASRPPRTLTECIWAHWDVFERRHRKLGQRRSWQICPALPQCASGTIWLVKMIPSLSSDLALSQW